MRQFATLIFVLIYLVGSSGTQVQWHYCGSKISSVSFNKSESASCGCSKKSKKKTKKNCCKDSKVKYKTDNHKQSGFSFETIAMPPALQVNHVVVPLCHSVIIASYVKPPPGGLPSYIVSGNFRC